MLNWFSGRIENLKLIPEAEELKNIISLNNSRNNFN